MTDANTNKPNAKGYIQVEGEVLQALPNAMFQVKLDTGRELLCHISGRIRKNFINIVPGDRVMVDILALDPTKGRITFRTRS